MLWHSSCQDLFNFALSGVHYHSHFLYGTVQEWDGAVQAQRSHRLQARGSSSTASAAALQLFPSSGESQITFKKKKKKLFSLLNMSLGGWNNKGGCIPFRYLQLITVQKCDMLSYCTPLFISCLGEGGNMIKISSHSSAGCNVFSFVE